METPGARGMQWERARAFQEHLIGPLYETGCWTKYLMQQVSSYVAECDDGQMT